MSEAGSELAAARSAAEAGPRGAPTRAAGPPRPRRGLQLLDRVDATSGRDLLVDGIEAMGAGDDRRPRRGREPELDRAADLEELRGQEDVERPRHRIEGEDRRSVRLVTPLGGELD